MHDGALACMLRGAFRFSFTLAADSRWLRFLNDCVTHRFTMPIYTDNCTAMGLNYQENALSKSLGNRFRVFRTCAKATQIQRLRDISEEALWPFFDQHLGRFSTKTLVDFRPRILVSFRPKPWPISDQKNIHLNRAHGPWKAPLRRDAGVR